MVQETVRVGSEQERDTYGLILAVLLAVLFLVVLFLVVLVLVVLVLVLLISFAGLRLDLQHSIRHQGRHRRLRKRCC